MVIGYHIIFGAYGFWLPNDPRGSWSERVWAPHLQPLGEATKVTTRQSLAARQHNHAARLEAKRRLKYPAVRFNPAQIREVAQGFAQIVDTLRIPVYACAIMPDHVHLVMGRHGRHAEDLAGFLKRAATRQLAAEGLHPMENYRRPNGRVPSPWAEGTWCVYLEAPQQVRQRIEYVQRNPIEAGLPPQRWPFVVPYVA